MKNIHILPTDKPSRLHYFKANKAGFYIYPNKEYINPINPNCINQNIYITSDEEIKEGWYINIHTKNIVKGSDVDENWKCIILTTDQDLIKDDVQAINDEFLEWFVKNSSCEWVELRNKYISQLNKPSIKIYKIIIPKEEAKQERMYSEEEVIELLIYAIHESRMQDNKSKDKILSETLEEFKKK